MDPGAESARPVGLRALARYFLGLGAWGFGGPIATVGYMQRDLVELRGWVSRQDFLDGVALGQTMPGPLAAQVVMWVGFLEAGATGALATAVPFIAPSLAIVVTVAFFYVRYQGLEVVQALFYGIAPAAMAVIAVAAVKLARLTNAHDARLWSISAITLAVTALTGTEIALLFVAAGIAMMLWEAPPSRWRAGAMVASPPIVLLANGALLGTANAGVVLLLGLFFVKAGAFIFGSGLAIVPFLQAGVVEEHHWLTERQFLDAVAMGLITPGPVVITAAFIGYLVAGPAGAAVSTIGIFLPIYLGVVLPGHWFVRHREHPALRGFVRGATAAAAGAIGGATIVLARGAIVDAKTAVVAALALAFVLRFRNREPVLVLLAGIAGVLLSR